MTLVNNTTTLLDDFTLSYSTLTCPYTNLAIENELINANFEKSNHLFFYRNDPCIVMGRFQVPWREVNMPKFLDSPLNLKMVRRRSGGGTVYHDLGNWNYCFIHKQRDLPRIENLELLIKLLANVGIHVEANERYDLVYRESEDKVFKVSGAAFKQKKDTCLHHGTLLMDAGLTSLKGLLGHPKEWELEGKGVKSHPSAVINLAEVFRPLNFEQWITSIENSTSQKAHCWDESSLSLEIEQERDCLRSWSWCWAETPHFSAKLPLHLSQHNHQYLFTKWEKGQCVKAQIQAGNLDIELTSLIGRYLGPKENYNSLCAELENEFGVIPGLRDGLSHFFFK